MGAQVHVRFVLASKSSLTAEHGIESSTAL